MTHLIHFFSTDPCPSASTLCGYQVHVCEFLWSQGTLLPKIQKLDFLISKVMKGRLLFLIDLLSTIPPLQGARAIENKEQ